MASVSGKIAMRSKHIVTQYKIKSKTHRFLLFLLDWQSIPSNWLKKETTAVVNILVQWWSRTSSISSYISTALMYVWIPSLAVNQSTNHPAPSLNMLPSQYSYAQYFITAKFLQWNIFHVPSIHDGKPCRLFHAPEWENWAKLLSVLLCVLSKVNAGKNYIHFWFACESKCIDHSNYTGIKWTLPAVFYFNNNLFITVTYLLHWQDDICIWKSLAIYTSYYIGIWLWFDMFNRWTQLWIYDTTFLAFILLYPLLLIPGFKEQYPRMSPEWILDKPRALGLGPHPHLSGAYSPSYFLTISLPLPPSQTHMQRLQTADTLPI